MPKTLMIAMMAIHLFGNTEFSELFRLPKLISHYLQHKKENPLITFGNFLDMHYGGDDGTSADDTTDKQLPYQHNNHHSLFGKYFPLNQNSLTLKEAVWVLDYDDQLVVDRLSKHVSLVLQPPRTV